MACVCIDLDGMACIEVVSVVCIELASCACSHRVITKCDRVRGIEPAAGVRSTSRPPDFRHAP
jgi:hypothetical protein